MSDARLKTEPTTKEPSRMEGSSANAQSWLDAFMSANLGRFSGQLISAADYALDCSGDTALDDENRLAYAEDAKELAVMATQLQFAQEQLEKARQLFVLRYGDTPDGDHWIFADDQLD